MTQEALPEPRPGLTLRACVIAVAFLFLGNLWVYQAELVTITCQVSMSVPAIPALMGLVFLAGLRPVLRRVSRRLALTRRELLVIYTVLVLGMALASGGALRQFMPNVVALQYFASPENRWEEFIPHVPSWMAPQDSEVIRTFFEGSEKGVPWGAWLVPLGSWMLFFLLLLTAMHFMAELFVDHWRERERLGFALNELPLMLTQEGKGQGLGALWRDPVMWIGFGLVTIHNVLNILNAFNPGVPALGLSYHVGGLFQERPLAALQVVSAHWYPEVFGFGYLMPLEVVTSSLLAYGLILAESVGAVALGYDIPRFPHLESQAAGGFVGLALILAWGARHHLRHMARTRPAVVAGFVVMAVASGAWWVAAGMSPLTAAGFFLLIFLFALSYSRLRCEAGVPIWWAYPVTQQYRLLVAIFGSAPFEVDGTLRNLTIMSMGWFLPRGYLPLVGACQFEGLDLAHRGGVRRGDMVVTLFLAIVVGTIFSLGTQLHAYYQYGANFLEGGTHSGGMRVSSATYAFNLVAGYSRGHASPDTGESLAALWGFVATCGLIALRHTFLAFPIHPLGFVLGTVRGYRTWAPLLSAAIIKTFVLRIGGVGLYRRLIPGALGVVLGHFVVAGGIWSLVGAFGGDAFRAYQVWFG